MPTIDTAAVTACAFIALFVGHQLGDHVLTRNAAMNAKGMPADDRLAAGVHPWTGWPACAEHCAGYGLAQAVAMAVTSFAAPFTVTGVVVALIVSASTHAVIDRRWIVQAIIRAKRCQDWPQGPYLIDQALHYGVLLVAAVLAATVQSTTGVGVTATAGAGMIAGALAIERLRARSAPTRIGDPHRL